MQAELTPIVVFAYNRPDHLQDCLESLALNKGAALSPLTIYCDGPKEGDETAATNSARQIAQKWAQSKPSPFARVQVVERPKNLGLANSVISGVSEALSIHDRVIVVEDDLVLSSDFLSFMNQGLELYQYDAEVISIHGFMYAVDTDLGQSVFLRGADCWGWATWRRGWDLFRPDSSELLRELQDRTDRKDFDFGGAFPYTQMLKEQARGNIDSWAVRWYASAFLADKLTLYPGSSLVSNLGQDASGTNYKLLEQAKASHQPMLNKLSQPLKKIQLVESQIARQAVSSLLLDSTATPFFSRVKSFIARLSF